MEREGEALRLWTCPHCGRCSGRPDRVRRTVIRGRRLAAIRSDRGLTQRELGLAIRKSGQTIASLVMT
jgi:hypothetical protein